jgi:lipoprotein NlpD
VSERSGGSAAASRGSAPPSGAYRVREGDTLYSIAWRHGLDWRELARRNGIGPPWTIRAGQRLVLASAGAPTGTARGEASGSSSPSAARRAPAPAPGAAPRWDWPLAGPVVRGFARSGSALNQGIDLRGSAGADVRVAAPGEIVYAGTGLRGFAQLVIVKHDDTWLSAYGLGARILVKEGQRLARGDRLARLEAADGEAPLLHFEIRRNGEPVDPLRQLPAR